jgi:hypothetical protein
LTSPRKALRAVGNAVAALGGGADKIDRVVITLGLGA